MSFWLFKWTINDYFFFLTGTHEPELYDDLAEEGKSYIQLQSGFMEICQDLLYFCVLSVPFKHDHLALIKLMEVKLPLPV